RAVPREPLVELPTLGRVRPSDLGLALVARRCPSPGPHRVGDLRRIANGEDEQCRECRCLHSLDSFGLGMIRPTRQSITAPRPVTIAATCDLEHWPCDLRGTRLFYSSPPPWRRRRRALRASEGPRRIGSGRSAAFTGSCRDRPSSASRRRTFPSASPSVARAI